MSVISEILDSLPISRKTLWMALGLIVALYLLTPTSNYDRTAMSFQGAIDERVARVETSVDKLGVADPQLLNCIRAAARDRSRIHPASTGGIDDVRELTALYCPSSNITSLAGLGQLDRLAYLDLSGNRIESLGPLRDHPALQRLQLPRNPIGDIEVAASLPQLQQIELPDLPGERCTDVESMFSLVKSNAGRIKCAGRKAAGQALPSMASVTGYNKSRQEEKNNQYQVRQLSAAEQEELLKYEQEIRNRNN